MKHHFQFRKENSNTQAHEHAHRVESTVRDFASVEELLRYDAEQVAAPEDLRKRVSDSIGRESKTSWWRRFRMTRD